MFGKTARDGAANGAGKGESVRTTVLMLLVGLAALNPVAAQTPGRTVPPAPRVAAAPAAPASVAPVKRAPAKPVHAVKKPAMHPASPKRHVAAKPKKTRPHHAAHVSHKPAPKPSSDVVRPRV